MFKAVLGQKCKSTGKLPVGEKKRATLADVAIVAGVSKMTASRALRGASDVSNQSLEKVQQAAKDIGYVGNHLAMSLSNQRSDLIGVVIPGLKNIVFAEVLSGIAEGIEGSGMQPVFGVTDYSLEKEYDVIRNMLSWNPAGLIVTGLDQPEYTQRLLKNADIPIVQIMDLDGTPVDACVGLSHRAAGEAMALALIQRGKKRFGYVGCGLESDSRAQKRLAGFKECLSQNNIEFKKIELGQGLSTLKAGRELTSQLLASNPDLDCIYYSNDDLAAGGAFHCIAAGIPVPEQILLAGFNGLDIIDSLPIRIATSKSPRREIGRTAAEIVVGNSRKEYAGKGQRIEFVPKIELTD